MGPTQGGRGNAPVRLVCQQILRSILLWLVSNAFCRDRRVWTHTKVREHAFYTFDREGKPLIFCGMPVLKRNRIIVDYGVSR
jgi:hypothetical protein